MEIAKDNLIIIEIDVTDKMLDGVVVNLKGVLQIIWERGFVDKN